MKANEKKKKEKNGSRETHGLGHWQSKFPVVAVKACSICKNWKMYAGNCVTDFFLDAYWDFRDELLPKRSTEHGIMTFPSKGKDCADLRMGVCEC